MGSSKSMAKKARKRNGRHNTGEEVVMILKGQKPVVKGGRLVGFMNYGPGAGAKS